MTQNFTLLKQLNAIDEVLRIQRTMKKFNKFINHFIGMSITFGSICTITYVNLLYFDTIRKIDFSIGGMSECLSLIFIICYFSNKPNHNYNKWLDKFEKLELKNTAHTELTEIPKYQNRSVFAKNYRLWYRMSRKKFKNHKVANLPSRGLTPSDTTMYRYNSVMTKKH